MLWLSDGSARSSRALTFLLAVVLLNSPAPVVLGLKTTPGSPCTDVCGTTTNTTSSEITCLDQAYNQSSVGQDFEKCISCQLDSEFHDANTGESDVNWALCMSYQLSEIAEFRVPLRSNRLNQITCATLSRPVYLDIRIQSPMSRRRVQSHAMACVSP
jgi:hypothetical protein